jgi:lipoprotein-anchoring transpeptidase ErfK/SrfK
MSHAFQAPPRRRSYPITVLILAALIVATMIIGTFLALGSASSARAREAVSLEGYPPGVIVIRTNERRLFLTLGQGLAIRYPVAVGKHGHAWLGVAHVDGKYVRPAWSPPASVKRDIPSLPDVIPGGSPHNPMGERALTLDRDEIAIHGTTAQMRKSVGTAASYGCIRMYNEDVIDLYDRVAVGTPVVVLP